MAIIQSFAPIEHEHATILILGSMPGVASLCAGEYYAHPRNYFWRMMGALISLDPESPYEQRVHALKSAGIAVWDVLHSCTREGSLDTNIDKASQTPNDFQAFFACHANITHVFFNGIAAEQIYRRNVLPVLNVQHIEYLRLPSTSPANASIPFERKLEAWKSILQRN
jgi:TDG/mug DNA glycosylase family protein